MPFPSIRILPSITETLQYINITGGSYDRFGVWVDGTTETVPFKGTILPLTEEQLKRDINGDYSEESYNLYTVENFEKTQIINHPAGGFRYEIQEKDNRLTFANYRKYIIRRVGEIIE